MTKRIFWTAGEYRFSRKRDAAKFATNRRIDALCKWKMLATEREITEDPMLGCVDWVRLDRCEQMEVIDA